MSNFKNHVGLAALAAALAAIAVPATAQDRGHGRWNNENPDASVQRAVRVEQRSEQRAARVQQRSEQRAAQVDRRSEQRAVRVERQGDRAAAQAARQGNWGQARQIDRRSEQAARQVEQRGDWRANRVERQGDQRAARVERRGDWRANQARQAEAQVPQRNRTYTDTSRNTTYGRVAENNTGWRDGNRRGDNNQWRDGDRRGDNNTQWRDGRRDSNQWSNNRGDYQRWDRRWRNNNRYDWQRYRSTNRIVFNVGTYYSPYRNYSYRRFGTGSFLDSLFFGSRYWINDPWQYRLPEVYGPYRWVRYYDDVLLVDIYSPERSSSAGVSGPVGAKPSCRKARGLLLLAQRLASAARVVERPADAAVRHQCPRAHAQSRQGQPALHRRQGP
jgi:hypothetical protein